MFAEESLNETSSLASQDGELLDEQAVLERHRSILIALSPEALRVRFSDTGSPLILGVAGGYNNQQAAFYSYEYRSEALRVLLCPEVIGARPV